MMTVLDQPGAKPLVRVSSALTAAPTGHIRYDDSAQFHTTGKVMKWKPELKTDHCYIFDGFCRRNLINERPPLPTFTTTTSIVEE